MSLGRWLAVAALLGSVVVDPVGAQQSSDSLVYKTVFAHFFARFPTKSVPATVWIGDSTFAAVDFAKYARGSTLARVVQGYSVDSALPGRLEAAIGAKEAVSALQLPGGIRVADRSALDSLPREQMRLAPQVLSGNHFPPSGVFGLSRIVYDYDRSHALVLYSWRYCGARCGEVLVGYLARQADGTWLYVRTFAIWAS